MTDKTEARLLVLESTVQRLVHLSAKKPDPRATPEEYMKEMLTGELNHLKDRMNSLVKAVEGFAQTQVEMKERLNDTNYNILERSEDINLLNNRIDTIACTLAEMSDFIGFHEFRHGAGTRAMPEYDRSIPKGVKTDEEAERMNAEMHNKDDSDDFHNEDLERAMTDMATQGIGAIKMEHVPAAELWVEKEVEMGMITPMRRIHIASAGLIIGEGVEFLDGIMVRWFPPINLRGMYPDLDEAKKMHGLSDRTVIVYFD